MNYVAALSSLLSVLEFGNLKFKNYSLRYKKELWSLKALNGEALTKADFQLHFLTSKYTQRLLWTKSPNICLCCLRLTVPFFYLSVTT